MNFSAKNPPHRQAENRYAQCHADKFDQEYVRQTFYRLTNSTTLATLLVLVTITLTSFSDTDDCKRLGDGKYKVRFKRFPKSNYILSIDKNQFTKTDKKGQETKGTIEWSGDCSFILSSDTVTLDNPLAEKIKLGLGVPSYELTKTKGRVTSFVLTRSANLNIMLDEGKLIKLD